jgi:hypothetical protein
MSDVTCRDALIQRVHGCTGAGNCIGTDIDGEDIGQLLEAFVNPATAVFEALSGLAVLATKKGAANATGDAVIVGGSFQRDLRLPWFWHGITP